MAEQVRLKDMEEYFRPFDKRSSNGVFFCRMVGYDETSILFLSRYYFHCKQLGIYLKEALKNPSEEEVSSFIRTVEVGFNCCYDYMRHVVTRWMNDLNPSQKQLLWDALWQEISLLKNEGSGESILKNAVVKYLCWAKKIFSGLLGKLPFTSAPKILYEGDISKYELGMLRILSTLGCDVLIVNFAGEGSYKKADASLRYSQAIYYPQAGTPEVHFTQIDWAQEEKRQAVKQELAQLEDCTVTNQWLGENLWEDCMKPAEQRGHTPGKLYNLFVELQGVEEAELYLNELFQLRQKLSQKERPYVLVEKFIENPSMEEVEKIKLPVCQSSEELILALIEAFQVSGTHLQNQLGKKAFLEILNKEKSANLGKLKNIGVCLLCWIQRYQKELFSNRGTQVPLFLLYGCCEGQNESRFLNLLAAMGVDVLVLCPDLSLESRLEGDKVQRRKLPNSMALEGYPKIQPKIALSTMAYRAEQELDTLLYQDTGLYRTQQFVRSSPVILKTTYEEIDILWREEAKYRPHFRAGENTVCVPVIFAQVSGVKNENLLMYKEEIRKKITEDTIFISEVPCLKGTDDNPIKPYVTQFFKDGKIMKEAVCKHPRYAYGYLKENVQELIFEKIQELIDQKLIRSPGGGVEYLILSTLLNLDKKTLRLIQKYDFTKEIPKLVLVHTKESVCSLEDAVYITFLSLIGFDVLLYLPTGYQVFAQYLDKPLMEEHQAGEYMFDLNLEGLAGYQPNEGAGGGFLNKLFGRGRN